jgi:hypothetical protein
MIILISVIGEYQVTAQTNDESSNRLIKRTYDIPPKATTDLYNGIHLNQAERALFKDDDKIMKQWKSLINPFDFILLILTYTVERWDTSCDNWVNSWGSIYGYDGYGNFIESLTGEWSGTSWVYRIKRTYTYDNQNRRKEYIEQWLNDDSSSMNYSKHIYTYNDKGIMIEDLYLLPMNDSTWVFFFKETYEYDSNLHMVEHITATWNDTVWVNYFKWINSFDISGRMILSLSQEWNGNSWENSEKYTYTYDNNGNRTIELNQNWDGNNWINNNQQIHSYDINGRRTEWIAQVWIETTWVNNYKNSFSYIGCGTLSEWLFQTWNDSVWVNDWRDNYIQDSKGYLAQVLTEKWDGHTWLNANRATYTYKELVLDIEDGYLSPGTFRLFDNYPNPFNPSTTIKYQLPIQNYVALKVFDVLGREVAILVNGIEQPGYKSVNFNAGGLTSGVYYYRLQAGNYIETKKLLLLR